MSSDKSWAVFGGDFLPWSRHLHIVAWTENGGRRPDGDISHVIIR